ncbi:MAG: Hsp20/alpha crystallin family protein [Promethearchaeota archaeon]|nr:MAG: Hsp20/alpha crystallin family protein [Candidatus Lokiarchaeota archaeon]
MPEKKDDNEDEEDEEKREPFDFLKFFENPNKFFSDPNKFLVDPTKLFRSKDFQRLFKDIFERISDNLPSEFQNLSPEDVMREFTKHKGKFGFPIMYGFNINIGPDGKPIIDSFGNLKAKPYSGEPEVKKAREPLTEVNEEGDQIIVICEMPGVTKDDIEIKADPRELTISTRTKEKGRNYYKVVKLPSTINTDHARARYTNGILEVKLKKIDEKQTDIRID